MKKKRNKTQKPNKSTTRSVAAEQPKNADRRSFLSRSGKYLVGMAVLGGGSIFAVSAVRATAHEQDISRIGRGVPTVVQIHDPSCSLCSALQKETRRALKGFDRDELDYVVANVKTDAGSAFAAQHGQPHVTLMLMDPSGKAMKILNGPQAAEDLRRIFEAHVAAYR